MSAVAFLYVAYALRYIQKMSTIHQLCYVQPASSSAVPGGGPAPKDTFAYVIGPRDWRLPNDGIERVTTVVHDIQETRPVRSLAIWGWEPGVYVLTGIPPATRDSVAYEMIAKGPLQPYFRTRFLDDLRANPPDLFIDAVAKGAFLWPTWTENDGYESNPQLRKFIEDNYVLVDDLALIKGGKPVRFFARRTDNAAGN